MLLVLAFTAVAQPIFAASQTVSNDTWWKDAAGNPIYAQGGNITLFNGTYYWYGVQYGGSSEYYASGVANSDTSFVSINVYTSTDLAHWTGHSAVVTTSTSGFSGTSWVGRVGSVLYNSNSKLYVMWVEYYGSGGNGMACLTSTSPLGPFTLHNVQTSITNVYYNTEGDSTMFIDVDHDSTPYFVFSDPHGRQHAYVSRLSSDYYTIEPATLIAEWPQGQEADNMFERNGLYYLIMSNLAGWSYSSAYAVWSSSPTTPADYTADAAFQGTTADYTHHSQVSFGLEIKGSSSTGYIMAGDRWSDFDSSYRSAGYGEGYNEWCPVSFNGNQPIYNSVGSFQVDAATGALDWGGGSTSYNFLQNRATGLDIDGLGATANGSTAGQWAHTGSTNQQWAVQTDGSYVRLQNSATGLFLDGEDVTSNGSVVGQWSDTNSYDQQWGEDSFGGGYYGFKNRATGMMIDGAGLTSNGSNLEQWSYTGSNNQQWSIQ